MNTGPDPDDSACECPGPHAPDCHVGCQQIIAVQESQLATLTARLDLLEGAVGMARHDAEQGRPLSKILHSLAYAPADQRIKRIEELLKGHSLGCGRYACGLCQVRQVMSL